MTVSEKIKLAYAGGKEERRILVGDANKLVGMAVLKSRGITLERDRGVLPDAPSRRRDLPDHRGPGASGSGGRRFILRLVKNPKVPLSITLPLVKQVPLRDLATDLARPEPRRRAAHRGRVRSWTKSAGRPRGPARWPLPGQPVSRIVRLPRKLVGARHDRRRCPETSTTTICLAWRATPPKPRSGSAFERSRAKPIRTARPGQEGRGRGSIPGPHGSRQRSDERPSGARPTTSTGRCSRARASAPATATRSLRTT